MMEEKFYYIIGGGIITGVLNLVVIPIIYYAVVAKIKEIVQDGMEKSEKKFEDRIDKIEIKFEDKIEKSGKEYDEKFDKLREQKSENQKDIAVLENNFSRLDLRLKEIFDFIQKGFAEIHNDCRIHHSKGII